MPFFCRSGHPVVTMDQILDFVGHLLQLVEVPTVVSHSSPQERFAEQNVDIPVPRTRVIMKVFMVFPQDMVRCSAL